jgi:hypothetical protein
MMSVPNAAAVDKEKDHAASLAVYWIAEVETALGFVDAGKEEDSSAGGVDDSAEAGDLVVKM